MKRILFPLIFLSLLLALLPSCKQSVDEPDSPDFIATQCPNPGGTQAVPDVKPPEPSAPTPEPAVGMDIVKNALIDCCGDELAGLESYSVSTFKDSEDFLPMINEIYGIDMTW